ncbi:MAG: hypothetical protein J0L80_06855 [Chitinophagales bacterium]|nr:hypothetical protein [Chitinophagales bacterium]
MKYFSIILCTFFLAVSCTKIEDKDRIIYGQIVDSVNVPIANKEFLIVVSTTTTRIGAGNGFIDDQPYKFNTDTNGSFSVTFKAKKKASIQIRLSEKTGDNTIYRSWGAGKDLEINAGIVKMPRR